MSGRLPSVPVDGRSKELAMAMSTRLEAVPAAVSHFSPVELAHLHGRRVEEIEEAMRLIDEGGYGLCSACGVAVPYERLEAVPATRRCVCCQATGRAR
jgi:hypothetical protein